MAFAVSQLLGIGAPGPYDTPVSTAEDAIRLMNSDHKVAVPSSAMAVEVLVHFGMPRDIAVDRCFDGLGAQPSPQPQATRRAAESLDWGYDPDTGGAYGDFWTDVIEYSVDEANDPEWFAGVIAVAEEQQQEKAREMGIVYGSVTVERLRELWDEWMEEH